LLIHKRYQALNKAKWIIDENLVFPNSIAGKLDEKKDRAEFKKLLKAAGVPDYQLYQLRKTCLTNMAQQTDVRTLQAFSGHTSTKTLEDHYITPQNSAIREAANRVERAMLDEQERYGIKGA